MGPDCGPIIAPLVITLRPQKLLRVFWEKVWALGVKAWDPAMKVQEP